MKTYKSKSNAAGRYSIRIRLTIFTLIVLAVSAAGILRAAPNAFGTPKTSRHDSFKPENFERIAVIVKPVEAQSMGFNMNAANNLNGMNANNRRNRVMRQQAQSERLVEQEFMRVLLGDGYTLVSRTDLDAAMKERGLDEAKLTDEKLTEEAGKLLHVSAILVVSVDAFKTEVVQRQVNRTQGVNTGYNNEPQPYYQVVVSVAARLIKISDNMVMWTGDLTDTKAFANQIEDSAVLAAVSENIATAFPPLTPKKISATP